MSVEGSSASKSNSNASENSGSLSLDAFYAVKEGMTRVFTKDGIEIPVTVLKLIPNKVSQVKTNEKDGHTAYQVAYYEKRKKLVNRPLQGHLKKANIEETFARFAEIRTNKVNVENLGKEVDHNNFPKGTFVDVTSTSKGKGFQGVVKRYHFAGGPATHGSHFHRRPGSIGNRATPARVFPNKKMPGQMGNKKVTVQNLEVYDINLEKKYILIKGSVPGHKSSFILVKKSKKK